MSLQNTVATHAYSTDSINSIGTQNESNLAIQTGKLSVQSAHPSINGVVQKTDNLSKLDNGLRTMLSSETKIISNGYFGGGDISTDSDIYSNDVYSASGGKVQIGHNITTEGNIYLSGETVKGIDSVLYSKNGDISFNCNTLVNFKGIIYAPNGIVTINSANAIIDGIIIAKEVYVQANTFTINNNEDISRIFDDISFIHIDQLMSLYQDIDTNTKEVILAWDNNESITSVDIYRRYNNELSFKKIDTTSDAEYRISSDTINNSVDYKIIAHSKFHEDISSNVVTFVQNEKGISVEDVDTDKDGITDGYEISIGTNPKISDTDNDGFSDGYEVNTLYTDPLIANTNEDFDGDGLTNLQEKSLGTNPYLTDSDFDGISDNSDPLPLKAESYSSVQTDVEIPINTNEFDLVARYYDDNGNKCETIYNYLTDKVKYSSDAKGKTYNIYDDNCNLSAEINVVDGDNVVNTYSYDENNNISSIATNGFRYDFSYDQNGDLNSVGIGDRVLLSNEYNNETLVSESYGNGDKSEYDYDDNGNLLSQKINGKEVYKWTYDNEGKLLTYTDLIENSVYTYSYDEDNNTKSVSSDNGFSVTYDDTDNSYSVTYTNGNITKTNSMTTETDDLNNSITTSNFISDGKIVSVLSTDNSETKTMYSNDNEIMKQVVTHDEDGDCKVEYHDGKVLQYSYDENGNIVAISENGNTKISFEYDNREQLIRENNAYIGKSVVYTYDIAGNILTATTYAYTADDLGDVISTKEYSYDDSNWKDLMTSFNGENITYDEIGNPLLYRNGMRFEWTDRQLDSILTNGKRIEYQYNDSGIRTSKTINGVKTSFQLDETKIVSETNCMSTKWFMYDAEDSIIGFEYNNSVYYFEKNAQGDVTRIFDAQGNFVSEYFYDAWGNIISITGNTDVAYANPFRYRGYYYDNESGLYYLQSRYYDSYTGRFLNADSDEVILLHEFNLISYCNNNPVNCVDYDGNWFYTLSGYYNYKMSHLNNQRLKASFKVNYNAIKKRMENNKKLWNNYNKYVNGQGRGNISKMDLGSGGSVAHCGCEVIAIYNAMKRIYKFSPLYHIITEMEINNCLWLSGAWGVDYDDIAKYLDAHKVGYKPYTCFSKFEKDAKKRGKTCIISFITTNSKFGIHTVALYWSGSYWVVYNRYNSSTKEETFKKLSDICSKGKFKKGYFI